MLVSILVPLTMLICLPLWFRLHYEWIGRRAYWVFGYLILHSLIAFPIDLLAHFMDIGQPSAPIAFYPLVILNVFLGPLLITLATIYEVVLFWINGGEETCYIVSGLISWSRKIVTDEYETYPVLYPLFVTLAPSIGATLEILWGVLVFCWRIIAGSLAGSIVPPSQIPTLQIPTKEYLSVHLPRLVGFIPPLVIAAIIISCSL